MYRSCVLQKSLKSISIVLSSSNVLHYGESKKLIYYNIVCNYHHVIIMLIGRLQLLQLNLISLIDLLLFSQSSCKQVFLQVQNGHVAICYGRIPLIVASYCFFKLTSYYQSHSSSCKLLFSVIQMETLRYAMKDFLDVRLSLRVASCFSKSTHYSHSRQVSQCSTLQMQTLQYVWLIQTQ